jgi:hypothetical protein
MIQNGPITQIGPIEKGSNVVAKQLFGQCAAALAGRSPKIFRTAPSRQPAPTDPREEEAQKINQIREINELLSV